MPRPFWPLLLILAVLCSPGLMAAAPGETSLVRGELQANTTGIIPGRPFALAITLHIQPDWHIYWQNPGDSGLKTRFDVKLPPGFAASDVRWPLPQTFHQPGDITGYGYGDVATFLVTVTPPADLVQGEKVPLEVTVNWLCCHDVCKPGSTQLRLDLPVKSSGSQANAAFFAEADKLIPAATPSAGTTIDVQHTPQGDRVDYQLNLVLPGVAREAEVFPSEIDGINVEKITVVPAGKEVRVSFSLRSLAGRKVGTGKLPLLVTCTDVTGTRHGFYTTVDLKFDDP